MNANNKEAHCQAKYQWFVKFPILHCFDAFLCHPDENTKEKTIEQLRKEVKCYQKAALLAVSNRGINYSF